jgi:Fe-S-cluster containining protein
VQPIYALSIHADYKCRHSGACCSADWDVPVELPVYRSLSEALTGGRLQPAGMADDGPFIVGPDVPEDAAAMLARTPGGDCVFFHRGSGLCVVHRDLGEPALPSTCRHFPRIAVRDRRGTFITLSHFCPTAASMLFREDMPLEIVDAPGAFPSGDYEGLNVHPDAWPPMLHPRMLMDLEGYSAWGRHMVRRCAAPACAPESVVVTLARDARLLRAWKPADGPLASAVAALPAGVVAAHVALTLDDSLRLFEEAMRAVPEDLEPEPDEAGLDGVYAAVVRPAWSRFPAPINRFLAAKAFAAWSAYQGRGLLSIVRGLETALAILRVQAARQCRHARRGLDEELLREAFRGADFVLNHLAVGEELAAIWSRAE